MGFDLLNSSGDTNERAIATVYGVLAGAAVTTGIMIHVVDPDAAKYYYPFALGATVLVFSSVLANDWKNAGCALLGAIAGASGSAVGASVALADPYEPLLPQIMHTLHLASNEEASPVRVTRGPNGNFVTSIQSKLLDKALI